MRSGEAGFFILAAMRSTKIIFLLSWLVVTSIITFITEDLQVFPARPVMELMANKHDRYVVSEVHLVTEACLMIPGLVLAVIADAIIRMRSSSRAHSISPGHTGVFIRRKSEEWQFLLDWKVRIDGKTVKYLVFNEYCFIPVEPGAHILTVSGLGKRSMEFELMLQWREMVSLKTYYGILVRNVDGLPLNLKGIVVERCAGIEIV